MATKKKAATAKKSVKTVKKTAAAKTVKKVSATAKKTAKKPAAKAARKGSKYVCAVCGLAVTVDNVCGCVESCDLICCGQQMKTKK